MRRTCTTLPRSWPSSKPFPSRRAFRRRLVLKALEEHHIPLESLSAVCGRGGVLKPVHGGTYLTTDAMIDTLKKGPYGHHASNLGGLLAR